MLRLVKIGSFCVCWFPINIPNLNCFVYSSQSWPQDSSSHLIPWPQHYHRDWCCQGRLIESDHRVAWKGDTLESADFSPQRECAMVFITRLQVLTLRPNGNTGKLHSYHFCYLQEGRVDAQQIKCASYSSDSRTNPIQNLEDPTKNLQTISSEQTES